MTEPPNEDVMVLRRAKQLISERGWRAKGGPAKFGPICVDQAILLAADRQDSLRAPARAWFITAVDGRTEHSHPAIEVWAWNDAQESVGPVLAAFDRAISLAEAGQ